MNRRQRRDAVTLAALCLLIGTVAWVWYSNGWEAALRQLIIFILAMVVVFVLVWWQSRGKP